MISDLKDLIKSLKPLEKILKIDFKKKEYLLNALVHRSYLNERKDFPLPQNERLEFLGDAVLELIVSKYLFTTYKKRPEGELTSFRSAIVKTPTLADASRRLDYGKFLLMSSGEEATGGREREQILANTYEAVLGAIYLDKGYKVAEKFVNWSLLPLMDEIVEKRLDIDSKSMFQEKVQEILRVTPEYELLKADGPDHNKVFTMAVYVDRKQFGQGEGKSKQEAEQNAAAEGLRTLEKRYKSARVG